MNCKACELEMNHLLCEIPSKWRSQIVNVICNNIVNQELDCQKVYDCLGDTVGQLDPSCLATPEVWSSLPFAAQIQLIIDKICEITDVAFTLYTEDTITVDISGDGTIGSPISAIVIVDTTTGGGDNVLTVTANGLYVQPLTIVAGEGISVDNTNPFAPIVSATVPPFFPQGLQDVITVDPVLTLDNIISQEELLLTWQLSSGATVEWGGPIGSEHFDAYFENATGGYGEIYAEGNYAAIYSRDGVNNQNSWVKVEGSDLNMLMTTWTFDTSTFPSGIGYVPMDVLGTGNLTMQPIPAFYIEVTKTQLDTHITNSTLVPGATYKIMGVHPELYNDSVSNLTPALIKAASTNELETSGYGFFHNPIYAGVAGYGIWNSRNKFTPSAITGTFNFTEAITNNLGGTGTLYSAIEDGYFIITGGTWAGATSITGNATAATANISAITIKSFALGSKTIWGGYVWQNVNGNVGAAVNSLALNAEWTKIPYNLIDYDLVIDAIDYSYEDDKITRRRDVVSDNTVFYTMGDIAMMAQPFHAISVFQWGNKFTASSGTGSNRILNSYVDNINHEGFYFYNNNFEQNSYYTNNTCTSDSYGIYWNSVKNKSFINGNIITNGSTIDNMDMSAGSSIRFNYIFNNSSIFENTFAGAGYIGYNNLSGNVYVRQNNLVGASYIYNNTVRGNSGSCQIYGNSMYRAAYLRDMNIDTRTAGGTAVYPVMNNVMYGGTGNFVIGYNNTTNPSIIGYNTLVGFGQIVENNITSGEISGLNLTNCMLSRNNIRNNGFITNITSTNHHIERLEVVATRANYNSVALTAPSRDAKYSQNQNVYPFSVTFTGGAGLGAVGNVTIENFTVPIGFFIEEVLIDVGGGLTSAGAAILNLGIATDDTDSGLNNVNGVVSNLNTYGVSRFQMGTSGFSKATAIRRIVMSVSGAAITAGTATIIVRLAKLA